MPIFLFLLWLLLNGRFTADAGMLQICLTGIIVVGVISVFMYKALGYSVKAELRLWRMFPILLLYVIILVKEVFVANFKMIKLIVSKKKAIHPAIIKLHISLKSKFLKTLLANSITLTPGTITVDVEQDCYTVHCVDSSFAQGIENSAIVKVLERIETQ